MRAEQKYEPRMHTDEHGWEEGVIERVIGAAFEVANTLGGGFLEKVYERARLAELRSRGLNAKAQAPFAVTYKDQIVGEYLADIVVEDAIVIEIKCVDSFSNEHLAQCLNYLKASGKHLALIVNFRHSKLQWRRVIL